MIYPEFREMLWKGADGYDSIVFNPYKWLGAQFDCSVQFLRDETAELKMEPEYLKTTGQEVTNYSEWTIPLGRRFRALKISFRMGSDDEMQQRLVDAINDDGRIYVTPGSHQGRRVIRFQVDQFDTTQDDVMMSERVIGEVRDQKR